MTTATWSRDVSMPGQPGGMRDGVVLSVLVHAALILALAFGLSWRSHLPEAVQAELWAAVPQVVASRDVAPAPAPAAVPKPMPRLLEPPVSQSADAQIAIQKAQRAARELEAQKERAALQRRLAEEKARVAARKLEDDKRRAQDDARIAAQREVNLKRMLGQAAAVASTQGVSARSAGPSASYAARIRARIKPNIVYTERVAGDLVTEVDVSCAPDGRIVSRKLVRSSGVNAWDEAVLRAIDKTEALPRDIDGTVPSQLRIKFNARDF